MKSLTLLSGQPVISNHAKTWPQTHEAPVKNRDISSHHSHIHVSDMMHQSMCLAPALASDAKTLLTSIDSTHCLPRLCTQVALVAAQAAEE